MTHWSHALRPQVEPNFLTQDSYGNPEAARQDDFKNQYSTFIEELQETTEKLMNEVFNTEYKPEIDDLWDGEFNPNANSNTKRSPKRLGKTQLNSRLSKYNNLVKQNNQIDGSQSFQNFMSRNNKWCQKKQDFIEKQKQKKQIQQQKQVTLVPRILRGSIEKLEPIYERALELHSSKQKKIALKKMEVKRREDQQIRSHPFHPEIISKDGKPRTLQQYLRDKEEWERKKNQAREVRKIQQQASKYLQCSFTPNLVSKQIHMQSTRLRAGQKVEQRLLRSLQKAFQQV